MLCLCYNNKNEKKHLLPTTTNCNNRQLKQHTHVPFVTTELKIIYIWNWNQIKDLKQKIHRKKRTKEQTNERTNEQTNVRPNTREQCWRQNELSSWSPRWQRSWRVHSLVPAFAAVWWLGAIVPTVVLATVSVHVMAVWGTGVAQTDGWTFQTCCSSRRMPCFMGRSELLAGGGVGRGREVIF